MSWATYFAWIGNKLETVFHGITKLYEILLNSEHFLTERQISLQTHHPSAFHCSPWGSASQGNHPPQRRAMQPRGQAESKRHFLKAVFAIARLTLLLVWKNRNPGSWLGFVVNFPFWLSFECCENRVVCLQLLFLAFSNSSKIFSCKKWDQYLCVCGI